jgi:hypothetical protein
MKARIFANIGCWILVLPLVLGVAFYFLLFCHECETLPMSRGYLSILYRWTDVIVMTLSYLTPVAVAGVVSLGFFCRFGLVTKTHVVMAAIITLCFTLAPLFFGLFVWHECHVVFRMPRLQYWAWWLQPVSALWLSAYAMSLVSLRAGFFSRYYRFIPVACYSSILFFLGVALAWKVVTQDFAMSLVNAFAVIPLAVAWISVIRLGFMWTNSLAAGPAGCRPPGDRLWLAIKDQWRRGG